MHPHTVHIHNILHTSYILIWVIWVFGILGETNTTNKNKTTKQTFPKISPKFFLNENDYHLQSN